MIRQTQEDIQLVVGYLERHCQYVKNIHKDCWQRFDDWKCAVLGGMIDHYILCSVEDYSGLLQLCGILCHLHDWQLMQETQINHIYIGITI